MKWYKSNLIWEIIILAVGAIIAEIVLKTQGTTLIIMGFFVMPMVIVIHYYFQENE